MLKDLIPPAARETYRDVRKCFLDPSKNRLVNYLYGDTLTISYEGTQMIFDTSSVVAKRWFYPRYRDGSLHEPNVSKTLFEILDQDTVFVDIGANVGFYTVLASNCASEVHSFEMDPRLAGVVAAHLEKDSTVRSTVEVVPAAVSDTTGKFVSFSPHITDNLSTNTISVESSGTSMSNFRVPTVALDDYADRMGLAPDIMKLDVEGAEMSALKGVGDVLESHVQTLLLEVHPNLLDDHGSSVSAVLNYLDKLGFTYNHFMNRRNNNNDQILTSISDSSEISENCMLLCAQ